MNAVYVWGVTRALGGQVRLRIEDHDRIRSRPEYERALLDDLDWLGFVPDTGRQPIDRQSDRPGIYEAAVRALARDHRVYACRCSRRDIGSDRYDGRCRDRELPFSDGAGVRVAIDAGPERALDLLMGTLEQDPAQQCGDLLLRDRDGHWTYQFAVTVDDLMQEVTLIIRGADLMTSTGRQVRLGRMLGRAEAATFLHHPLIWGAHGEKLSKAMRDTGVRELRAHGVEPAEVVGRAAGAVGLIRPGMSVHAAEVAELFF